MLVESNPTLSTPTVAPTQLVSRAQKKVSPQPALSSPVG